MTSSHNCDPVVDSQSTFLCLKNSQACEFQAFQPFRPEAQPCIQDYIGAFWMNGSCWEKLLAKCASVNRHSVVKSPFLVQPSKQHCIWYATQWNTEIKFATRVCDAKNEVGGEHSHECIFPQSDVLWHTEHWNLLLWNAARIFPEDRANCASKRFLTIL